MDRPTSPPPDPALARESHLPQILAVQTVVVFLAVLFVVLRLYVRIKMIKTVGVDDWTVAAAAVRSSFLAVVVFRVLTDGCLSALLYRHMDPLRLPRIPRIGPPYRLHFRREQAKAQPDPVLAGHHLQLSGNGSAEDINRSESATA